MADSNPTQLKIYMSGVIDNPLFREPRQDGMPEVTETIEKWKRIAYLLWCNNGTFEVRSWGVLDTGEFPWKQGLTQQEALELIYIGAVVNACSWYERDTFETVFTPLINQYIEQILAFNKKYWEQKNQIKP
jgi:hypothetical protein